MAIFVNKELQFGITSVAYSSSNISSYPYVYSLAMHAGRFDTNNSIAWYGGSNYRTILCVK